MSCIDTWYRSMLRDTSRVVEYSALIPSQSSLNNFFLNKTQASNSNSSYIFVIAIYIFVFICVFGGGYPCATMYVRKPVDSLWGSFLFYRMGPEDGIQVFRLGAGVFTLSAVLTALRYHSKNDIQIQYKPNMPLFFPLSSLSQKKGNE